jgi:hypothetical protein
LATEWIVETRSGGKCVVRVVHSLFTTADDWDNQLESSEGGWPGFFDILRLYLTHFRGQPCSAFQLMAVAPEPDSSAWNVLTGSLGLTGAAVGERRATPASSPRLAAVVESAGDGEHPCSLLLRLEQPTSGIAHLFALAWGAKSTCRSVSTCTATRPPPSWRATSRYGRRGSTRIFLRRPTCVMTDDPKAYVDRDVL